MRVDYAIRLTIGLALLAVIGLVLVIATNRAKRSNVILLVGLLVLGLVATPWVRRERFREPGEDLLIVEVDGRPQTEVALIGGCLSVFRQVGPLSFIVGNDLFPGNAWTGVPSPTVKPPGVREPSISPIRSAPVSGYLATHRPATH